MPTPARFHALQWFADHEDLGRTAMLTRTPPSTKMRRLMAKEGQAVRIPVGQLDHYQWRLTPLGRETLAKKPPPRKRSAPDAKRRSTESGERSP